jgi:hypothetical protein
LNRTYTRNGKWLIDSRGRLIWADRCCCPDDEAGTGTGTGTGPTGTVVTTCCPDPVPERLYLTITASSCACLVGTVVPLTHGLFGAGFWGGYSTTNVCVDVAPGDAPCAEASRLQFNLDCVSATFWRLSAGADCTGEPAPTSLASGVIGNPTGTCDPIDLTLSSSMDICICDRILGVPTWVPFTCMISVRITE